MDESVITALQMAEQEGFFHGRLVKVNRKGLKQNRFFVIVGSNLWYFKEQKSAKALNNLFLPFYNLRVDGVEIKMKSLEKRKKDYLMVAESREAAKKWLEKLDAAKNGYVQSSYDTLQRRPRNDSGFGSMSSTSSRSRPVSIDQEMYIPEEIFMGQMNKATADMLITHATETGMYMFYKDNYDSNVLAVKHNDGRAVHFMILEDKENQFYLNHSVKFKSLLTLVMYYKENILPGTNMTLHLPLRKSK